jgi:hypothetical protein
LVISILLDMVYYEISLKTDELAVDSTADWKNPLVP